MPDSESHREDVEQINQIRREVEAAENAGDPSFVDVYCTDDVVAMPPGQAPNVGKDAAKSNLRDLYSTVDVEIEYTSKEVVVGDEFAFDRGSGTTVHTHKETGEPTEHSGNYLWLYRQTADGEWRQYRVIWNIQSD